jgi:hypothetical protein
VGLDELGRWREDAEDLVGRAFAKSEALAPPSPAAMVNAVYASGLVSRLPESSGAVAALVAGEYRDPSKLVNPF